MTALSDEKLRELLIGQPEEGWRAFIDQYTPTLVALIERAGVRERDAVTDVYVRVCERLAAEECRRLRGFDPAKGALAAWLAIVVRHAVVDWLRSRSGRRRLFGAVRRLPAFDQRVFELYYWEQRSVSEVAGLLEQETPPRREIAPLRVLEALARIERVLSERHRSELLSQLARARDPRSLDELDSSREPAATDDDPERAATRRQLDARLASVIASLSREDAAILRLTFVQGWSRSVVRRALHLRELSQERIESILAALRERLESHGIAAADAATPGLAFFEDEKT